MITQGIRTHALGECFQAHRRLLEAASSVARTLPPYDETRSLLDLASSCMRTRAQEGLASRDPRETLRAWRECSLAERQIRIGTYRAFDTGRIDRKTYDAIFALATEAARLREYERQRVRRELLLLAII